MSNYYVGWERKLCRNRPEAIEKAMPLAKERIDCYGYEIPIFNSSKPDAVPRWFLQVLFDHKTNRKCIVLRDEHTQKVRNIYVDYTAVRTPPEGVR